MALSHDIAILKYNRGDIVAAAEIWGGSSSTSPDVSSSSSSSSVGIVKILLNGGWTLAGIAAAQMLCDCYKRIAISPPESLVLPPPPLLLGGDNSQDDPSRQSTLTTTTISISGVVSRFLRCALDLLVEWNGNMAASAASTVVDDVWSLAAGKQDEANTDGGKMVLDSGMYEWVAYLFS